MWYVQFCIYVIYLLLHHQANTRTPSDSVLEDVYDTVTKA
jgi:hypothetical protein